MPQKDSMVSNQRADSDLVHAVIRARTTDRTHSWLASPVGAERSRLRYRTGLPSDSA